MRDPFLRAELAARGVFFPPTAVLGHDGSPEQEARFRAWGGDYRLAADANPGLVTSDLRIALDAQPGLITAPNAGVPALFTSIVDPEVVRVIFTPILAATIMGGETQKGDWTTQVAYFPLAENTGQVASYGDYSNNGSVDVNANWIPRQPFSYQTFKRYGERLLAQWGAAGINYSSELDQSVAIVFGKFQNRSYFYGVAGLVNYGLLNDPSLLPSISPSAKANTAQGVTWRLATAMEVYNDVLSLYTQLVLQMGGNVQMNETMTLALSTNRMPSLAKTNDFGLTAEAIIKQSFPNLTIIAAPEYSTPSGELMQLIVPRFEGQQTAYPAYTEKQRAHALVTEPSAWTQKVSAGTFGTIVRRPICIASMLGI
jgi:hypothetical protein